MRTNDSHALEPFVLSISVSPDDIDQLGHVSNIVYVKWIQEAAIAHWRAAAPQAEQERLLWGVLRHEINYKQAAYLGDELALKTWVGLASRIKFERHTELIRASDKCVLATALTIWCPVDSKSGKPAKVGEELRTLFSRTSPVTKLPVE